MSDPIKVSIVEGCAWYIQLGEKVVGLYLRNYHTLPPTQLDEILLQFRDSTEPRLTIQALGTEDFLLLPKLLKTVTPHTVTLHGDFIADWILDLLLPRPIELNIWTERFNINRLFTNGVPNTVSINLLERRSEGDRVTYMDTMSYHSKSWYESLQLSRYTLHVLFHDNQPKAYRTSVMRCVLQWMEHVAATLEEVKWISLEDPFSDMVHAWGPHLRNCPKLRTVSVCYEISDLDARKTYEFRASIAPARLWMMNDKVIEYAKLYKIWDRCFLLAYGGLKPDLIRLVNTYVTPRRPSSYDSYDSDRSYDSDPSDRSYD